MDTLLLAHPSKVIRTTFARHLADYCQLVEVPDGDTAWQQLVLNQSINGIITALDLAGQTGMDLLDRVRKNRLARINSLPFWFVGSAKHIEEVAPTAKAMGITGLLFDNMVKEALIAALSGKAAAKNGGIDDEPILITNLLSEKDLKAKVLGDYAGKPVGLILFHLQGAKKLADRLGAPAVDGLIGKLALSLHAKIRPDDLLGLADLGSFIVATPDVGPEQCANFKNRLLKELERLHVQIQGKPQALDITAAIATSPADGESNQLLSVARQRLNA
ncbi:MAG: diguanylate cyclase [Zoogloeaceae bacterium]|jgi:GGDEF domain-containing protein|nr:diguanylate cyclase [Zoogloeaceae bacterium]